jgi:hypothetical protein
MCVPNIFEIINAFSNPKKMKKFSISEIIDLMLFSNKVLQINEEKFILMIEWDQTNITSIAMKMAPFKTTKQMIYSFAKTLRFSNIDQKIEHGVKTNEYIAESN